MEDAPEHEGVLFLGDLVGYGPNPNEVADRVTGLKCQAMLLGNHDLAALGRLDLGLFNPAAKVAAEWTASRLSTEARRLLEGLEPAARVKISADGKDRQVFLAHASPRDPVWEYMEEPWQGPPNFDYFVGEAAFVGHTHVPRVFEERGGPSKVFIPHTGQVVELGEGPRRIVNPGGVGQPRDGNPAAAYAILDGPSLTFTFHRVEYPVAKTQEEILEAGLPAQLAYRLAFGL